MQFTSKLTADFLRMVLLPITHRSAYRHEAGIGAFVVSDLVFANAVLSEIVGDIFGKGRDHLLIAKSSSNSIAKPNRPTVDAFTERIEVG